MLVRNISWSTKYKRDWASILDPVIEQSPNANPIEWDTDST